MLALLAATTVQWAESWLGLERLWPHVFTRQSQVQAAPQPQSEWTWASVSANQSRPLGPSANRSGPWLAWHQTGSFRPRDGPEDRGAERRTTLYRQLTVTRCTLSPSSQAQLSPSVAPTRVSRSPRASRCAWDVSQCWWDSPGVKKCSALLTAAAYSL